MPDKTLTTKAVTEATSAHCSNCLKSHRFETETSSKEMEQTASEKIILFQCILTRQIKSIIVRE